MTPGSGMTKVHAMHRDLLLKLSSGLWTLETRETTREARHHCGNFPVTETLLQNASILASHHTTFISIKVLNVSS